MTEYTYTDHTGDLLTVTPNADTETPAVYIETGPDYATNTSVVVPVARLHDVIAGLLAQAAAAQGRTWVSALAQARDDQAAAAEERIPAAWTYEDRRAAELAIGRCVDEHFPLLVALAEAYTGQDAELWREYRRVRGQRDFAQKCTEGLRVANHGLAEARDNALREVDKLRDQLAAAPASTAPLAAGHPHVQGRCPACGRASLFLGAEGYVTCAQLHCTAPDAASSTLDTGTYDSPDDTTQYATGGTITNLAPVGEGDNDGCIIPTSPATAEHEAIVWTGDNIDAVTTFMAPDEPIYVNSLSHLRFTNADDLVGVNTADGLKIAKIGDSIVRTDGRLTVLARP